MPKDKRVSQQLSQEKMVGRPWYRRFPWLPVLGSILIFVSWVFQYKYASEATEERLRLERTQTAIDLQQLRLDQWNILYLQEMSKKDADQKVILAATFKQLQSSLNLTAWSSARVDDPAQAAQDIAEKKQAEARLMELYKAGNFQALDSDLKKSVTIENEFNLTETLNNAFSRKYSQLVADERLKTWIFLATFILGSVMIGVDFMWRASTPDPFRGRHNP
jgi:hypothetical protein